MDSAQLQSGMRGLSIDPWKVECLRVHGSKPLIPLWQDTQEGFLEEAVPDRPPEMVKVIIFLVLRPWEPKDERGTALLQGSTDSAGRRQGCPSSD